MRDTEQSPFSVTTRRGQILRGVTDLPVGDEAHPVVVINHGFKGFLEWGFFPHLAELLASRGFAVIRWNTSGSGMAPGDELVTDPEAFAQATFSKDVDEILTIVDAVPEILGDRAIADRIGLFGHSRGGGASVIAAAEATPTPLALVTWAAIASFDRISGEDKAHWRERGWIPVVNGRTGQETRIDVSVLEDLETNRERLDIVAAARRLAAPWLIVHGSGDMTVSIEDGWALEQAGRKAERLEIEHAGHTFEARHPFSGPTPALIEAINATQAWFLRYL